MRDGLHYDLDYPGDPVRQAVDAVTPYFPDEVNQQTLLNLWYHCHRSSHILGRDSTA